VAIALSMVILSMSMSYGVLTSLFTGASSGAAGLDQLAFMDGFHRIFLVGALFSLLAIICSSLRGAEGEVESGPAVQKSRVASTEPALQSSKVR
jgi:hypothetical protein